MKPRTHILFLLLGLPVLAAASNVIQPEGLTLVPTQQQQFTLPIGYENVIWSVVPDGMGTITSAGLYTAPQAYGTAYIYAQTSPDSPPFMTPVYIGHSYSGISGTPGPSSGPSPINGPVGSGPITNPFGPTVGTGTGVSIQVSPSSIYLQPGQRVVFLPQVMGTNNQQVQWSLTPNLGTILNGLYTAPLDFANDTQVTLSATSVADPTQTATATILLGQPVTSVAPIVANVSISLSPATTTLLPGQSAQFTTSVQGAVNTGVSWSIAPNVGSLVNGLYTAPSSVASQQVVMLTAISQADPTKTAVSSIVLAANAPPPVSINLSPGSVSLNPGQSATFTPTISGTSNTAVMWLLTPNVGSIVNGVYTAPSSVSSQQTITITATSQADSTKTAASSITLTPNPAPVTIRLSPATVMLKASQSATFTAAIGGSSNTAVTWSLSPNVGSVVNGVYTAPSTVSSQETITITATSQADSTKKAVSSVVLTASAPATSVTISLWPGSASLSGGQAATFTPAISGSSNRAVTWSMTPHMGTIVNGVYTAPSTVTSQRTVTITATSQADSTKTADSFISLTPNAPSAVTISLSPATLTLNPGQSATFTAAVGGASNTAVNWSLSPNVGSIVNGV